AVIIVAIYWAATLMGLWLRASGIEINPDVAIYRFIELNTGGVGRGLMLAAIVASSISTSNSVLVVLGGAFLRDLKLLKDGRTTRLIAMVSCGMVAGVLAVLYHDLVQLVLNAIFVLGIVSIPVLGIFIRRVSERGAFYSVLVGATATIVFLFWLPKTAFIPGALLAVSVYLLGYISDRRVAPKTDL
ncbi:MAG TPA: hypothetical protein VJQ48_10115, partial [Candidatus Binatia bacterium]|nr:hypothetical protein [Candidatus Binatia bacterium]